MPSLKSSSSQLKISAKKLTVELVDCFFVAVNLMNCNIGSGILSLSFALVTSGVGIGTILICLFCATSAHTTIALVKSAELSKSTSYLEVVRSAIGTPGLLIISIFHVLMPCVTLASFGIAVSDNMVHISANFFMEGSLLKFRPVLALVPTLLLVLPISMLPNIKLLEKISGLSVLCVFTYMGILLWNVPKLIQNTMILPDVWIFWRKGWMSSLGIYAYSIAIHFNVLPIYRTLKRRNICKFTHTAHFALFLIMLIYLLSSFCGFIAFNLSVEGDLFNSFCDDSITANLARILFAITITLTAPVCVFALKEGALAIRIQNRHLSKFQSIISLVGTVIFYISGACSLDLASVEELAGNVIIIPIILTFPSFCLWKHYGSTVPSYSIRKVVLMLLVVFGILAQIIATVSSVKNFYSNKTRYPRYWCSDTNIVAPQINFTSREIIKDIWSAQTVHKE